MTAPTCHLRMTYKQGSECGHPAPYRIYGVDCYSCESVGAVPCAGHPVCVDCAARLRTESVAQVPARSGRTLPAFTVDRIHSVPVLAGAS